MPWWRWEQLDQNGWPCASSRLILLSSQAGDSFSCRRLPHLGPSDNNSLGSSAFVPQVSPTPLCYAHRVLCLALPLSPLMDTGCFPVALQKCPAPGRLSTVSRPHVSFWMQSLIYSWFLLRFLLLKKKPRWSPQRCAGKLSVLFYNDGVRMLGWHGPVSLLLSGTGSLASFLPLPKLLLVGGSWKVVLFSM